MQVTIIRIPYIVLLLESDLFFIQYFSDYSKQMMYVEHE